MNATRNITFDGVQAPVALRNCHELEATIRQILPRWRFTSEARAPQPPPFLTISAVADGKYLTFSPETGPGKRFDAINTICDMVVELNREALRVDPAQLCIHGAGVAFGDRLVVFPNRRRAGKSLLSACLARNGHKVFTDDILPLKIDPHGRVTGMANGISPRLRLPLPDNLGRDAITWIGDMPGPANRQYKYLSLPNLPKRGDVLPLGAVVFLDRDGTAVPQLDPVSPADALEALLNQNFARSAHSGAILRAFEALCASIPLYRIAYGAAEPAAALLSREFGQWDSPPPASAALRALGLDLATPAQQEAEAPEFEPARAYVRAAGLTETTINGRHYIADASGTGIYGLNDGALVIWRLIEEPMTIAEANAILAGAYPDADPDSIAEDTGRTLRFLVQARLAVPA